MLFSSLTASASEVWTSFEDLVGDLLSTFLIISLSSISFSKDSCSYGNSSIWSLSSDEALLRVSFSFAFSIDSSMMLISFVLLPSCVLRFKLLSSKAYFYHYFRYWLLTKSIHISCIILLYLFLLLNSYYIIILLKSIKSLI